MQMKSKNDCNWYQNYEALKAYIQERGHLPYKYVVENSALLFVGEIPKEEDQGRNAG